MRIVKRRGKLSTAAHGVANMPSNEPVLSAASGVAIEARLARLEAHTEHIVSDVADLRAGLTRLEGKVDQGFARLDAKMDQGFARQDARMERQDARMERLDSKMDQGFARQDAKMDQGFARLDAKIDRHFLILGGMIVSLGVGMAGLMARGFHWF